MDVRARELGREAHMVSGKIVMLLTGVVTLAAAGVAHAQWNTNTPRNGACFYEDEDFRGSSFCVAAGEDMSSLVRGANDRVSSIRIFGNAEVTVFRDTRFRGASERFSSSIRNLGGGWNDEISSVRVDARFGGGGWGSGSGGGWGGGGRPGWGSGGGNPDAIVRRAYQDILEREPDQAGLRLYRSRIIDDGWTEQQVREALRRSPEYRERNTMTRARAEEIVRNAYLSVLGREPDPGARGYVDRVFRDKWSQQDVERELRKSPEYRQRRPPR